jgi:hypothetical protein
MTTLATLNQLIEHINDMTGSPREPWTRENRTCKANIGNYHLSQACGGVNLHRVGDESGCVTSPISGGHVTKKELEAQLRAFINGIQATKG